VEAAFQGAVAEGGISENKSAIGSIELMQVHIVRLEEIANDLNAIRQIKD